MLFEKLQAMPDGIRIQEYDKCLLFGFNGVFIKEEDIFNKGSLIYIDCISILKTTNGLEVAKFSNGTFNIELNLSIDDFINLDTRLKTTNGIKYRLTRTLDNTCTQYLYIFNQGALNI